VCTNFFIEAEDRSVVTGRSMEFGSDVASRLDLIPRGTTFSSPGINGAKGTDWAAKYGFVGISHAGGAAFPTGFNEKGLTADLLWFVDHQCPRPGPGDQALRNMDLTAWILSNFATVAEVKQALETVTVYSPLFEAWDMVIPGHWSVVDAQGNMIVIEPTEGRLLVVDNSDIGVMTNDPGIHYHRTNLRHYSHLHPLMELHPDLTQPGWAQGSGLMGLPGDTSSPSRFVRIAAFKFFADKPRDSTGAVNLAFHLLNTVDLPYGVDVYPGQRGLDGGPQYTPWVTVVDHAKRHYYYRTYDSLNVHRVDLNAFNFSPDQQRRSMGIFDQPSFIDDTERLEAAI